MFELEEAGAPAANIKVVGVGGAGGNVINNMIAHNIRSVDYIALNTDAQVLAGSMAGQKVQIGGAVTRGLGAGSKPEIGKQAAIEDKDRIADCLAGADMVFITAGMGGGTGTGASPVVAEIAKSMGALTVGVVTKPFNLEGGRRKFNAEQGLEELRKHVDSLIVIPNDKIGLVVQKGTPILKSFSIANDILRQAVQGISDIILVPGLINVDFADVRTVMESAGRTVMGMGVASGEGKAREAAKKAIVNPLLEDTSVEGASGILINITGGIELELTEVEEALAMVSDSAHPDAITILGAVIDPEVKDEVKVTVIATGFKRKEKAAEMSKAETKVDLPQARRWTAPPAPDLTAMPFRASERGAERILAKSLGGGFEDPLDIPAFLRKGLKPLPLGANPAQQV